jgi:putative ABC transport system ATP-binding protein
MNNIIIRTEGLEKVYGKGIVKTHALNGVKIETPKGSFACVTGPSGHGKSTLLHLVGGLDKPTKGSVYVDNVDITKLNSGKLAELRTEKIGFVCQFFNLLQNLTALENIETAMMFGKVPPKSQREKAAELLDLVGLAERANHKPNELSGGQKQRVSIARALANDPDILLMDEPTGNLDSKSEEEVFKHIFEIHKTGKTIVIVTHNNELAANADIIFEVRDGKIGCKN